jgi:YD repeat-containing protein
VNGVTPQTRYEYAQRYAWLRDSSGGYSQAASPIWMQVRERFCRTTNPSGSGCTGGAADEVVTDYDYGPNSGPNNLLLRGVAVTADGQTRRSCFGYDQMGRIISETSPNANLTSCP